MKHLRFLIAFSTVFVISATSSVANTSSAAVDHEAKSKIEDRLASAAKNVSRNATDKASSSSDRFAQWYNWNNWYNWDNWRNW